MGGNGMRGGILKSITNRIKGKQVKVDKDYFEQLEGWGKWSHQNVISNPNWFSTYFVDIPEGKKTTQSVNIDGQIVSVQDSVQYRPDGTMTLTIDDPNIIKLFRENESVKVLVSPSTVTLRDIDPSKDLSSLIKSIENSMALAPNGHVWMATYEKETPESLYVPQIVAYFRDHPTLDIRRADDENTIKIVVSKR
jgi:hypothetical protein